MTNKYILKNGELYHHGILGQKWGIRRFQNKDGSYTTEGKRRRREDSYSDDYKRVRDLKMKRPEELSNKELKEINIRDEEMNKYNRNNGKIFISNLGNNILQRTSGAIAGTAVALGIMYLSKKYPNIPWQRG